MRAQQSELCTQHRENKWLLKGRDGTDNATCIDRGRTLKLIVLVAVLLVEMFFSDLFYPALVHSRPEGVHGTT